MFRYTIIPRGREPFERDFAEHPQAGSIVGNDDTPERIWRLIEIDERALTATAVPADE